MSKSQLEVYCATVAANISELAPIINNVLKLAALEVNDVRAQFNAAINFALDESDGPTEACAFLEAWREGDLTHYPEFVPPAKETTT